MQLWKRHFFKEIFKTFFFFLFAFFTLYSILDYALRMDDFIQDDKLQLGDLFIFYSNQFLKRAPFLLPLSLLVSTIKVLTSLNIHREWLVLQLAGIRTRQLLGPFFIVAMGCVLFNWINLQYLLPPSIEKVTEFRVTHFKHSKRAQRQELIHILTLKDHSKLLYQSYDAEEKALFDVLWIRSIDDIWRIKFLNGDPSHPSGKYVDHLKRNSDGLLKKVESFESKLLSELKWHPKMAALSMVPFEDRSLSDLWKILFHSSSVTSYEIPKIISQLTYKVAIPLLSLMVVLMIAPFCISFSRAPKLFLNYALGIFALLALYTLIDAALILAEHRIFSPMIATLFPFIFSGTLFSWNFLRKT